ncbi:MAG: glycosyl hydrolase 2 galactose-binding domain-containing protein [Armatimonadota bacterium]
MHTRKSYIICIFTMLLVFVLHITASARPLNTYLVDGKFGKALDLSGGRQVTIPIKGMMNHPLIKFEFWTKLNQKTNYNILLAVAPKDGLHWEIYTEAPGVAPIPGVIALYMPQLPDPILRSTIDITDNKWHYIVFQVTDRRVQLHLDGVSIIDVTSPKPLRWDNSPLKIGGIEKEPLGCTGYIDELRISADTNSPSGYIPSNPPALDNSTFHLYRFDRMNGTTILDEMPKGKAVDGILTDEYTMPEGNIFLDEVQDEEYRNSGLYGDAMVEDESKLPVTVVKAVPFHGGNETYSTVDFGSLNGDWLMKECDSPTKSSDLSSGVLNGWWQDGFDRSSWRKVEVPTTVQNALIKSGELADPFWNTNTYDELVNFGTPKDQPWHYRKTRIEQKEWWFAKHFTLNEYMKGKKLLLYFDGIDYAGSFYLNGQPLGYHSGMFGGPSFDVTRLVHFDRQNELVIRLDKTADSWNGILKGSPGFGWHYGHLISTGIWRDVKIKTVPSIEISDPYVVTKSIGKNSAVLNIEYYITSYEHADRKMTVKGELLSVDSPKAVSFMNSINVRYGRQRFRTEVTVKNPLLWWPMNYGKPHTYTLMMHLFRNETRVNIAETRFGIRTIKMEPSAGTKSKTDYRWKFVINGQPIFIKGANWCWSDPMLQLDGRKYWRILELARRGGIQMFRAWGGGIVETDQFYEACDTLGLMVYQEFPYCWGPPPFPATDAAVLDQQVSQVVKRLRNHPSLIMWGGGNENGLNPGGDEALFLVGRRCRQFDPSRPYHRTDPWGGSAHNWSVFHGGAPIDSGYRAMSSVFYGEYGLPSMPNRSSVLRFLPESALNKWPIDDSDHGVIAHLNQFMPFDLLKTLKYADYGPVKSWDTYIEYSQMAQGDWLRYAAENQRAGSNENKSGFWFYKFTDLFPGHSWAVVDFYGAPKLSYYRAKQTCRPQSAFAVYPKLDWSQDESFIASLHVSNDTMTPLKGAKVKAVIFGSDLSVMWSKTYAIPAIPLNTRRNLGVLNLKLDPTKMKPFIMAVNMTDSKDKMISDQWYWFNFKSKTPSVLEFEKAPSPDRGTQGFAAYAEENEALLLNLPKTSLSVRTTFKDSQGYIIVRNNGDLPAFNVIIDGFPYGDWSHLDDNSFCLWPGEERKIGYELSGNASLDGVTIRAWNAQDVIKVE